MPTLLGGSLEQRYRLVRNQLDNLGYEEAFPVDALSVIERLVIDLLKTKESLKSLNKNADHYYKVAQELQFGVEPFKDETVRLCQENNELKQQLYAVQKHSQNFISENKLHIQDLEDENKDLKILVKQFIDQSKLQYKKQLKEIQEQGCAEKEDNSFGAVTITSDSEKITISARRLIMEVHCDSPSSCPFCIRIRNYVEFSVDSENNPKALDYIKLADSRIECLQLQCRKYRDERKQLLSSMEKLKLQLSEAKPGEKGEIGTSKSIGDWKGNREHQLELSLKASQMQFDIVQKKNIELERKLRDAMLVDKNDLINKLKSGKGTPLNALDNWELDQAYPSFDEMSSEEKLKLLEAQLSHCCEEKAMLKYLLEQCEGKHNLRAPAPTPSTTGRSRNLDEGKTSFIGPNQGQSVSRKTSKVMSGKDLHRENSDQNQKRRSTFQGLSTSVKSSRLSHSNRPSMAGFNQLKSKDKFHPSSTITDTDSKKRSSYLRRSTDRIGIKDKIGELNKVPEEFESDPEDQYFSETESELEDQEDYVNPHSSDEFDNQAIVPNLQSKSRRVQIDSKSKFGSENLAPKQNQIRNEYDSKNLLQRGPKDASKLGTEPSTSNTRADNGENEANESSLQEDLSEDESSLHRRLLSVSRTKSMVVALTPGRKRIDSIMNPEPTNKEDPNSEFYENEDINIPSTAESKKFTPFEYQLRDEYASNKFLRRPKDASEPSTRRNTSTVGDKGNVDQLKEDEMEEPEPMQRKGDGYDSQQPLEVETGTKEAGSKRSSKRVSISSQFFKPTDQTSSHDENQHQPTAMRGRGIRKESSQSGPSNVKDQTKTSSNGIKKKSTEDLTSTPLADGDNVNDTRRLQRGSRTKSMISAAEARSKNQKDLEAARLAEETSDEDYDDTSERDTSEPAESRRQPSLQRQKTTTSLEDFASRKESQEPSNRVGGRTGSDPHSKEPLSETNARKSSKPSQAEISQAAHDEPLRKGSQESSKPGGGRTSSDPNTKGNKPLSETNARKSSKPSQAEILQAAHDEPLRKGSQESSKPGGGQTSSDPNTKGNKPQPETNARKSSKPSQAEISNAAQDEPLRKRSGESSKPGGGRTSSDPNTKGNKPLSETNARKSSKPNQAEISNATQDEPSRKKSQGSSKPGGDQPDKPQVGTNGRKSSKPKQADISDASQNEGEAAHDKSSRESVESSEIDFLLGAVDTKGRKRDSKRSPKTSLAAEEKDAHSNVTNEVSPSRVRSTGSRNIMQRIFGIGSNQGPSVPEESDGEEIRQLKAPPTEWKSNESLPRVPDRDNRDSSANKNKGKNASDSSDSRSQEQPRSNPQETYRKSSAGRTKPPDDEYKGDSRNTNLSSAQNYPTDYRVEITRPIDSRGSTYDSMGVGDPRYTPDFPNPKQRGSRFNSQLRPFDLPEPDRRPCPDESRSSIDCEREVLQLKASLKSLDRDKDEMRAELDKKDERLAMLLRENAQSKDEINKLQLKLKQSELQLGHIDDGNRDLERESTVLRRQNEALRKDLDQLARQRDDAHKELRKVTSSMSVTEIEKRNISVELMRTNQEADDLRLKLQRYIDEVRRIEELLQAKEEDLESILLQYRTLSEENTNLENYRSNLELEAHTFRQAARDAVEQTSTLRNQLSRQSTMVKSYEDEISRLSQQVASLETKLKSASDSATTLNQDTSIQRDYYLSLEKKLDEARLKLADTESSKKKVEADNRDLKYRIEEMLASLEKEQVKAKKHESLITQTKEAEFRLQNEMQGLMAERDALQQRIASLDHRNDQMDKDLAQFRMKYIETKTELERTTRQLESEQYERETVIMELKRLQEQLNTSSLNSLLASALESNRTTTDSSSPSTSRRPETSEFPRSSTARTDGVTSHIDKNKPSGSPKKDGDEYEPYDD